MWACSWCMSVPFFFSITTAFCRVDDMEFDLCAASGTAVFDTLPFGGPDASTVAALFEELGISLMSFSSTPISFSCFARFSSFDMNWIGADSASTKSENKKKCNRRTLLLSALLKCQSQAWRKKEGDADRMCKDTANWLTA